MTPEDHKILMMIAIGYTCVGVFMATALITLLSLVGVLHIEKDARKRLYKGLIFEIVAISLGIFSNFMTVSHKPIEARIDRLETSNQTFQAIPDKPVIQTSVPANITPRIYFHIQNEVQRAEAKKIQTALVEKTKFEVPSIQLIEEGPSQTELRYFKDSEAKEAQTISDALRTTGLVFTTKYVPGFEKSTFIRPRHYELWMAE